MSPNITWKENLNLIFQGHQTFKTKIHSCTFGLSKQKQHWIWNYVFHSHCWMRNIRDACICSSFLCRFLSVFFITYSFFWRVHVTLKSTYNTEVFMQHWIVISKTEERMYHWRVHITLKSVWKTWLKLTPKTILKTEECMQNYTVYTKPKITYNTEPYLHHRNHM